ncbi:MAG: glycosyltransferase family 2 protein [Rubripirellula sp.]|nr:glycosyltransferase family 2 protein [Rubripirellula sp.]
MVITACVALGLCFILSVSQIGVVLAFVRRFGSARPTDSAPQTRPRAAVILALRGPDPYLSDCLSRLLKQDYEDYSIFVVVDHAKDPVLRDVEALRANDASERLNICVLESPHTTCSLKCSSLIKALEQIDETYEVAAFLDGDVLPHATWLAELVSPLADESVGVATGNRWYVPSGRRWGSWIRYCWNAGAVVQVWLNRITWAGSMAMRISTIHKVELLAAWQRAFVDDATVHRKMHEHGLRVHFVPTVMMVNREEITTGSFVRWVQRQLLAAKSCGSGWRFVGLHALNLAVTQGLSIAMVATGVIAGNVPVAVIAGSGIATYWGSSLLAILIIELAIRRTVALHGEPIRWQGWGDLLRVSAAMLLTQVLYPFALATALCKRTVSWRGIEYRIHGDRDVEMVAYHPYVSPSGTDPTESVI